MNKVLICVHGIVESTKQFNDIIKYFKDIKCQIITLPGHDSTALNFGKHGLKDWRKALVDLIYKFHNEGNEIYAIGHSMGGLLLIDFIYNNPNIIKKLICLALPLKIRPKIKAMIRSCLVGLNLYSKNNVKLLEYSTYYALKPTKNIFSYYKWPLRYIELFKLSHLAKKYIKKISTPILIINSKADEMVSYKIDKYLMNNIKYLVYEKSSHNKYDQEERLNMLMEINKFINDIKNLGE